jgi:RNA polymerase primary sigma factor
MKDSVLTDNIKHIMSNALPPLSAAEERVLFETLAEARKCVDELLKKKRKLTNRQQKQLDEASMEVAELRDLAVRKNIALIMAMISKTWHKSEPPDEMLTDGMLTLLHCVDKFDHTKEIKFSTYACRALLNLFSRNGTVETRRRQRHSERNMPELPYRIDEDLQDDLKDLHDEITHNRANLTDLESFVVRMRYGLSGQDPMTLYDLGKIVGKTKESVRKIQNDALRKLRIVLHVDLPDKEQGAS